MSISSQTDLVDMTRNLMGGSVERVSDEGYDEATAQVEREIGITSYPVTDDTLCYWAVERLRRHVTYILMVESAHKFQYKQIHIEHRFKHYIQLIDKMDKEWENAMDDNPHLFGSTFTTFCSLLDPGFVYDSLGRDITYK